jgi:hypothetical protein
VLSAGLTAGGLPAHGRINPLSSALLQRGGSAKLLDRENLAAELAGRNYSAESVGKILGGNMKISKGKT